jgi:hypothetical protein
VPNKTIYVREADTELWEEAEKLAGGSLSGLIADALRRYIEEEKVKKELSMETIEVALGGRTYSARWVGFEGRWLVSPDEEMRTAEDHYDAGAYYGVALTKKGNIAVYCAHVNGGFDATLDHYPSFEAAEADGVPKDILAVAKNEADPNYVERLDI